MENTSVKKSKQSGQRGVNEPTYLERILPRYSNHKWLNGGVWRQIVRAQPINMVARQKIVDTVSSLARGRPLHRFHTPNPTIGIPF